MDKLRLAVLPLAVLAFVALGMAARTKSPWWAGAVVLCSVLGVVALAAESVLLVRARRARGQSPSSRELRDRETVGAQGMMEQW